MLAAETAVLPFGEVFNTIPSADVHRICLTHPAFQEQNICIQALLPFFIEGASPLEPCPNWHYFLIYGHSGQLMAIFTVYEAHLTLDKVRAKVSQVLVLQPY